MIRSLSVCGRPRIGGPKAHPRGEPSERRRAHAGHPVEVCEAPKRAALSGRDDAGGERGPHPRESVEGAEVGGVEVDRFGSGVDGGRLGGLVRRPRRAGPCEGRGGEEGDHEGGGLMV